MKISSSITALALLLTCAGSTSIAGSSIDPALEQAAREFIGANVSHVVTDARVVNAVLAQNEAHRQLTQTQIDELDQRWRRQSVSGGELVNRVLANDLSQYLRDVEHQSGGLITEIFVMDNRGLNVGQSAMTSDYWQGDEDKWRESYLAGPDAIFVDAVEFDESTQRYQTQVSLPVVEPGTGKAIGAVTVGIDADGLLMM